MGEQKGGSLGDLYRCREREDVYEMERKEAWEPVVLRDVLRWIAVWIDKFKVVGNNAVNHDPVHAALQWAAVRFVL